MAGQLRPCSRQSAHIWLGIIPPDRDFGPGPDADPPHSHARRVPSAPRALQANFMLPPYAYGDHAWPAYR
eukprot:363200-Chlamydomonas_euryale.AAC.7